MTTYALDDIARYARRYRVSYAQARAELGIAEARVGWGNPSRPTRETVQESARRVLETLNPDHGQSPATDIEQRTYMPSFSFTAADPAAFNRDLERAVLGLYHPPASRRVVAFPETAKKGARVRLTSKRADFVVEFVVRAAQTEWGKVISLTAEGQAAAPYRAEDYDYELVKAAPVPLPTKGGVYVLEKDAERYNAGQAVNVFTLHNTGAWSLRYGQGVTSTKTAAQVSAFAEGTKLVRLEVRPS